MRLLIGYQVVNAGTILAQKGVGGLAAGMEVLLQPLADEHVFIRTAAAQEKLDLGVDQQGTIEAIQAEIHADGGLYSLAIRCDGKLNARGVEKRDGKVFLIAEKGFIEFQGEAIAQTSEQKGGEVRILGETVHLVDNAEIDVSGELGGGVVLIGGNYQGQNTPGPKAELTYVDPLAKVNADATVSGDGGLVVFWSDGDIIYLGDTAARGGEERGNGGKIEVSSKRGYFFEGMANTSSPKGKSGMLLIDPCDITIAANGGVDSNVTTPSPATVTPGPCPPPGTITYAYGAGAVTIDNARLSAFLNCNDVMISTSSGSGGMGMISVNDPIMWSGNHSLTLQSDYDMFINASITSTGGTAIAPANLTLNANMTTATIISVKRAPYQCPDCLEPRYGFSSRSHGNRH